MLLKFCYVPLLKEFQNIILQMTFIHLGAIMITNSKLEGMSLFSLSLSLFKSFYSSLEKVLN